MIICDLNFKRTENHNFAITTNMSQHVEFFHSLIFLLSYTMGADTPLGRHPHEQTPPSGQTHPPERRPLKRVVHILLECILVVKLFLKCQGIFLCPCQVTKSTQLGKVIPNKHVGSIYWNAFLLLSYFLNVKEFFYVLAKLQSQHSWGRSFLISM